MKALNEKSLLINLQISQWTARKYDSKATNTVNREHNAKDAGRFNKILIAREHLQEIGKIANKARTFHYENTLPWSDSGDRLLPSENYFTYCEELAKIIAEFERAVKSFSIAYPAMIEEAKQNLNGLFNSHDYPSNIEERFNIKRSFMPVPDADDIRVNLSSDEIGKLKETVSNEINSRFADAQKSIYERISTQLKHMKERLTDNESIFKNTLFENVLSLVDLLPRLNVSGDSTIEKMCDELKSLYCDPENVRKDKDLRASKAAEVSAMLNKVNAFLTPVA